MRKLVWIVAAAAMLYGGFWVVASRGLLGSVETALSQMKAEGRADFADVSVAGFPSRLDLTIDQPSLVSADGRARWTAPFLQVFALSYRPNQIIAVWPHDQTVLLDNQTLTLNTSEMQASALFRASLDLPLDHSTMVATSGALASDLGWTATFDQLRLGSQITDETLLTHRIGLALTGLGTTGFDLPDSIDLGVQGNAEIDADLSFDRPPAINAEPAGLTGVDIRVLRARWGGAELHAKGTLDVTEAGTPEGRINLSLSGWQGLLDLAVSLGAIRPELAPTYASMLDQLAQASPDPARLELPLVFRGGQMSLGPLPLGPAPLLRPYRQ